VGLRWLAQGKPQAAAPAARANRDRQAALETAAEPLDPVRQAIDEIHRAMLDYAGEMKK
jgi:hypothetical protein